MNIVIQDKTIEIDGQPYIKGSIRPVQVGDNVSFLFPWYGNQSVWSGKWQEITLAGVPCESAAAFKAYQQTNFYPAVPAGMAVGKPVDGAAPSSLLGTDADGNLVTYSEWRHEVLVITDVDSGSVLPLRDLIVIIDAKNGNVFVQLPTAADAFNVDTKRSIKYHLKRIDNTPNNVSITVSQGGVIDDDGLGLAPVYLGKEQVASDGAKWWTI